MKIDLVKPARPYVWTDGDGNDVVQQGMTVREELWARFAAAALQGMYANPTTKAVGISTEEAQTKLSEHAMAQADAAIAAIEERQRDD